MAGVRIVDQDNGYRALVAETGRKRKVDVRVGVEASPREGEDLDNETLGAIHEFGLGTAPQRSFLRAWFDQEARWLPELRRFLEAPVRGEKLDLSYPEKFGRFCVEQIRARIRDGIDPPLLPETINRKENGATPLIETEQLLNSITFDVKEGP